MTCGAGAENLQLPPGLSVWDKSLNVRVAFGYKDNLLLSDQQREASPFLASALEVTLLRLPVDGREFHLFLSGEDIRYSQGRRVDKEQFAFGQMQFKQQFAGDWTAGITLRSVYQDAVFDASLTETNLFPLRVKGYSFTATPSLQYDFLNHYWLETGFGLTRQVFGESENAEGGLDDYWEGGPKVTLGRNYGRRSSLGLSYGFNRRSYDTRAPLNPDFSVMAGATLEYERHEVELALRHNWGQARHWRSVTSLGWDLSRDNGSGFFDYTRHRFSQQLRYVADAWEAKAQARVNYYEYPNQTVSSADLSPRQRTDLAFSLRGERKLGPKIKVYVEYEYGRALSNQTVSQYQANKVTGGIDWEF